MSFSEGTRSKSLLLGLPNELFIEVASHLESFQDLNSLVRTSRLVHEMFNSHLYRRAVADAIVLADVVNWVLSEYRLTSLTLLLDNGLSVDYTGRFSGDRYEESMLCFLCGLHDQERSATLARLLIQRGADTKAKSGRYSNIVLKKAIYYNNCPIVELLLAHGTDANAADIDGDLPLHFASRMARENAGMIHLLIAHGADIEACSALGDTPLTVASQHNHHAIAVLLELGADIEARSAFGDTPLIVASQHNHHAMAALLELGADAGVRGRRGETPLHRASAWFKSEHHELAKSLLEHGAIVNATDQYGDTPLHLSCEYHMGDALFMAKFLVENGADVNAISNDGFSPLRGALRCGCSADVVALLLEHGADVGVLSRDERSFLVSYKL
jgi:ankyrin repeat protein